MFACCILGAKSPQTTPCKKALPPVGLLIPSCSCGNIYTQKNNIWKTPNAQEYLRDSLDTYHYISTLLAEQRQAQCSARSGSAIPNSTPRVSWMPWESVRSDTFEKADCSTIDFHSREWVRHTNTPWNKLYEAVACNLAIWKLHAITHPQYYQNGA